MTYYFDFTRPTRFFSLFAYAIDCQAMASKIALCDQSALKTTPICIRVYFLTKFCKNSNCFTFNYICKTYFNGS